MFLHIAKKTDGLLFGHRHQRLPDHTKPAASQGAGAAAAAIVSIVTIDTTARLAHAHSSSHSAKCVQRALRITVHNAAAAVAVANERCAAVPLQDRTVARTGVPPTIVLTCLFFCFRQSAPCRVDSLVRRSMIGASRSRLLL